MSKIKVVKSRSKKEPQEQQMPVTKKACVYCKQVKRLVEFYPNKANPDGVQAHCKKCHARYNEVVVRGDPRKRLWHSSYMEAKRKKLAYSLKPEMIQLPERCEYLEVELDYLALNRGRGRRPPFAPTLSRIDPAEGFVEGNIEVISTAAHIMKNDAAATTLTCFARNIIKKFGEG